MQQLTPDDYESKLCHDWLELNDKQMNYFNVIIEKKRHKYS